MTDRTLTLDDRKRHYMEVRDGLGHRYAWATWVRGQYSTPSRWELWRAGSTPLDWDRAFVDTDEQAVALLKSWFPEVRP